MGAFNSAPPFFSYAIINRPRQITNNLSIYFLGAVFCLVQSADYIRLVAKKLTKADRDMIAAERIGAFFCQNPVIDRLLSGFTDDKDVKHIIIGSAVLKAADKIIGKKRG